MEGEVDDDDDDDRVVDDDLDDGGGVNRERMILARWTRCPTV